MNLKVIVVLFAIFFLSVVSVSAADENITNGDIVANIGDNTSSVSVEDDLLGVGMDEDSCDGDVLSVSAEDNVSSVNVCENKLSVSVDDSSISKSNSEQKISMSISQQDSKLSSIYDKVYSHKEWKSILLTKFNVKKSWSKHKRDKKIRKYWKKAMKKVNKLVKKYSKKGWVYEGTQWQWDVGNYKVKYRYYLQFSQTHYYNGYGEKIV